MAYSNKQLVKEFEIRLSEINAIAGYLKPSLSKLLMDASMGRGREFGIKRKVPIESRFGIVR